MTPAMPGEKPAGICLLDLIGPPTPEQARHLVSLLGLNRTRFAVEPPMPSEAIGEPSVAA